MRIALVLRQEKKEVEDRISRVIVFDVENDKVVGVENVDVASADLNTLSNWALTEQVEEIFVPEANDRVKPYFNLKGIEMKAYDELGDNKLFQTFIV